MPWFCAQVFIKIHAQKHKYVASMYYFEFGKETTVLTI